jgi:AraC-like DNA-binding protein
MKVRRVLANGNVVEYEKMGGQHLRLSTEAFHIRTVFNERQDILIGTRKFSIFPDCLAIIPPTCNGECIIEADAPVHTLAITLAPNFMATFLKQQYLLQKQWHEETIFDFSEATIIPMSTDMQQNFRHLWKKTAALNTQDALLNEYISRFLLDYINGHCKRFSAEQKRLPFTRLSTKTDISKRLLLAKEYISNNYNQKFHIGDVANYCCLSENHLLRTFKEMFGITPYQYLALIRLSRAKSYLEKGTCTINEIVIMIGFESVSTFIKLFKSTFKLTPLQYRKYTQQ